MDYTKIGLIIQVEVADDSDNGIVIFNMFYDFSTMLMMIVIRTDVVEDNNITYGVRDDAS